MDPALQDLIEVMPPIENPRFSEVDWNKLEERVGLRYPESFKEFVAVYGGSIWCGSWHPFFDEGKTDEALNKFMKTMSYHLSQMRDLGMVKWGHGEETSLPLYAEKGGLLPFLIDFDNICLYCWKTSNPDPDKWPVVCWIDRQVTEIRGITISGMFLEWLQRSSRMRKIWGDVEDVEADEMGLDRG